MANKKKLKRFQMTWVYPEGISAEEGRRTAVEAVANRMILEGAVILEDGKFVSGYNTATATVYAVVQNGETLYG